MLSETWGQLCSKQVHNFSCFLQRASFGAARPDFESEASGRRIRRALHTGLEMRLANLSKALSDKLSCWPVCNWSF